MKFLSLLSILFLSGLICSCTANPSLNNASWILTNSNTNLVSGSLTVRLNLSNTTPKSVYIWVTDSSNSRYIDTILRFNGPGKDKSGDNPANWRANTGMSELDGVSSATIYNNSNYTSPVWDCKARDSNPINKGFYKVWVEICVDQNYYLIPPLLSSGTIDLTGGSTNSALSPSNLEMGSGQIYFLKK